MALQNDHGPGLYLHVGNRLETLVSELAGIVRRPLASALAPETIVVQSRGMQRWVSMEIARINGIFSNGEFPFPNAFLHQICRLLVPDLPAAEESPFHPRAMSFGIMRLLPACLPLPGFEALRKYLDDDVDGLMLMQLSERVADLFDQYLLFRPDMVTEWEAGTAGHWQARLWRRLVRESPEALHRGRLRLALRDRIRQEGAPVRGIPERVSVFGISYLPPFHLDVLNAIAAWIPVYLFFVNPCREYWSDITDRRQTRRILRKYPGDGLDPGADLHLEEGNRLLAACGALGRDFLRLIGDFDVQAQEHFQDPGELCLLHRVQSDILHLKNAGGGRDADDSIRIHACHSPMREVEVLHDQLLAMFEEIPGLRPRDILVMAPDIEAYAPLIHAVFDSQDDEAVRIPYGVSDRSVRRESRISEGLLGILGLAGGRMEASSILELLEIRALKDRFGLSEGEIEMVERWVRDSGIRWGKDAQGRGRLGLPPFSENTWQAGVDRMLLGYAMPGEKDVYAGIVPFGHIEGSDVATLGKFLEFVQQLFDALERMEGARTPDRWRRLLDGILADFFQPSEDNEPELRVLRDLFDEMADCAARAGFDAPLALPVVRHWLSARLEKPSAGGGFLSGGGNLLPDASHAQHTVFSDLPDRDEQRCISQAVQRPGFRLDGSIPASG